MQQRKILLLENVASQAAGVREQLTRAGFLVAVSRYEADGLKRLAEWSPDLVLVSTAHPAGDFVDYCRRARPLAPAARFVVTSSLNRERLFQELPGLQGIVDGVLLRPFSHEEAIAALAAGRADRQAPAAAPPRVGRLVVVLDRDPELAALLRRGLEPHGVQVAVVPFEGIGAFCDAHRPAVLILEWPMPAEFIAGPLGRIRAGTGAPVAVLLLADSSQEAVSSSAPALVQTVDMFFRKPVAWEAFFRVLARHLGLPAIAALKPAAIEASAPAPRPEQAAGPGSDTDELRAEFQRQLEAKFLEVEELKRRLDAATRRGAAAPAGLEWLQSENEQLRQAVKEGERKLSLALATEQLKRSEIEVKLDNLLRMKEDFEFRAQNEIDERTRRIEELESRLRELEGLREGAERAGAEREAMRGELERSLVEKERIEERLHALESAPAPAVPEAPAPPAVDESRFAELEQETARCRAAAAEAQVALADASAKAAVLDEALSGERAAREELARGIEREREAAASAGREARERGAATEASLRAELAAEREKAAELHTLLEDLLRRLEAAEAATAASLAGQRAAEAGETELRNTLSAERQEREADARRDEERQRGLADVEERRAAVERELSASAERVRAMAADAERVRLQHEERERGLDAEVRSWRERAEALALELESARSQGSERAASDEQERRSLEARLAGAETAAREAEGRFKTLEQAGTAERETARAREEEVRLRLAAQQALTGELQEKLAERPAQPAEGEVAAELRRIQELLEEVISRARTDAVGNARREAETSARLQDALEERRLLQERFDRAAAEASERERRSATLLQSAIDRGPGAAPARDNLPALIPAAPEPRAARSRNLLAGLAVVAVLAGAAYFSLRPAAPPPAPVRPEQPQPAPQPAPPPASQAPRAPVVAEATPRDVWDRWTRSDSSGGVLVQATLRSEQEVRAEVDAERRARGRTDAQSRAELERRLGAFLFDRDHYFTVYLKNLSPGYPDYFEDLVGRFRLRDDSGRETPAFLPPGQEGDRRIFTFGSGPASGRVYEATLPLAFSRTGLSRSPRRLELVVADVGTASRRVLTWELE